MPFPAAQSVRKWLRRCRDLIVYRRKTPSIQQIEVRECGAAALGIVLAHYGRWAPINELRIACGVSRDGCTAGDLQRAADRYGVAIKGRRLPYRLLRSIRLPAILFWEFQHFCVLEGFRGSDFLINDPAQGHRVVREDEFARLYTGVALTLEPRPDFVKGGRPPRILDKLWPWFRPHRGLLLVALLCGLLSAVPTLAVPVLLGVFVDHAYADALGDALYVVGAVALAAVALFAFTWLQQHALNRLSLRVSVEQSTRLVSTLLRMPREVLRATSLAGDVALANVHLVDNVTDEGSTQLTGLFIELVSQRRPAGVDVYQDAWLATGVLAVAAANGVGAARAGQLRLHENHRLRQEQGRLLGFGAMGLQRLESIRASGTEAALFAALDGLPGPRTRHPATVRRVRRGDRHVSGVGAGAGRRRHSLFGTLRALGGALSLGDLAAYFLVSSRFLVPIGRFGRCRPTDSTCWRRTCRRIDDVVAGHEPLPALRQEPQPGLQLALLPGQVAPGRTP